MNNKETGNSGENRCCEFLQKNGYEIIQRNYRESSGEIDVIAIKNETIVFVEVKTLPNATLDMLQKVLNTEKQKRIVKTQMRFYNPFCDILNYLSSAKYLIVLTIWLV